MVSGSHSPCRAGELQAPQFGPVSPGLDEISQLGAKGDAVAQVVVAVHVFGPELSLPEIIDPFQQDRSQLAKFRG